MSPSEIHDRDSVSIGRATSNDSAGILDCLSAAFEPYRDKYTPGAYLNTVLTAGTVRKRMDEMAVFVAKYSDVVVGTIACQAVGNGEGHLRGMAVLPKGRGAGVAQRLLEAAEEELRQMRCTMVTLDTTEPLKRAIRFYEKNGYRPTGKVQDFFGMALYEYSKSL
jgi:ribosomal protein S18 acetylase RimI-like enzyme